MSNVNTKMTAIADEIRTLSGTSDSMGLDDMATHVGEANNEVDSQVELLAQAVAALEGKASGGDESSQFFAGKINLTTTFAPPSSSGTTYYIDLNGIADLNTADLLAIRIFSNIPIVQTVAVKENNSWSNIFYGTGSLSTLELTYNIEHNVISFLYDGSDTFTDAYLYIK